MTIWLANPWENICIGTAAITACLVLLFKRKLFRCIVDLRIRGFRSAFPDCVKAIRWPLLGSLIAFAISVGLVSYSHRDFWAVMVTDESLQLSCPWPRSKVHIVWSELDQVVTESRQFRFRYMTRLCIKSRDSLYCSPWGDEAGAFRAKQAIEEHQRAKQESTPRSNK